MSFRVHRYNGEITQGAVAEIKPAQQRVEKAKQERDKLKEKLER
jgi:hypothetical protein